MDQIAVKIAHFIDLSPEQASEDLFQEIALELFTYQYQNNAHYRRLCDANNAVPAAIDTWQKIPAAPVAAFKKFHMSCSPPSDWRAEFHSSGTTGAATSRHYMDAAALGLYEASLRRGFELAVTNRPPRIWAMMPPPTEAPHSSLTYMLETLGAERYFWADDATLSTELSSLSDPITLFGTAFAFVQLFDRDKQQWHLPDGSVIVETGGFKGRSREVSRPEFYSLFATRLGISSHRCYSEYGMCEMASQFYGVGEELVKCGPHWTRSRCIDPETGEDVDTGKSGLLRHLDLANINSVAALQTEDLGTIAGDGFLLHGRAGDAEIRGCSLLVEELWS